MDTIHNEPVRGVIGDVGIANLSGADVFAMMAREELAHPAHSSLDRHPTDRRGIGNHHLGDASH